MVTQFIEVDLEELRVAYNAFEAMNTDWKWTPLTDSFKAMKLCRNMLKNIFDSEELAQ